MEINILPPTDFNIHFHIHQLDRQHTHTYIQVGRRAAHARAQLAESDRPGQRADWPAGCDSTGEVIGFDLSLKPSEGIVCMHITRRCLWKFSIMIQNKHTVSHQARPTGRARPSDRQPAGRPAWPSSRPLRSIASTPTSTSTSAFLER